MATEILEQEVETQVTRRAATIEEFWALPESTSHTEYVNGEIIMAPSPTVAHQSLVRNIFRALDKHVNRAMEGELFLSPLDVVLPSGAVVQPDVFFLDAEQSKRAAADNVVRCAPSFLVEILSPGSMTHDTITKRALYERNGVHEYWIVDPLTKSVAQLVLRKKHYAVTELSGEDIIKSATLAGFEMHISTLLNS